MSFTNKLEVIKIVLLAVLAVAAIAWLVLIFTEKDVPNDSFKTLNRPQETHYVIPTP